MADDRHYVPGDYYQLDDNTGFKVRAKRTRVQWNGIVTTREHFNPRQPQDLVTGVRDDQSVPMPRPRQKNTFTIVASWVTAPAHRGANSLTVDSAVGFTAGDLCQVMLDSGANFQFTLGGVAGSVLSWSGAGLPASAGVLFAENTVTDLSSVGGT